MAIGTYISIITLNVNGLNASTKRHILAEWIQKQDPYISCLQARLLYLARISFQIDKQIKSFSDKRRLREFSTTKPALQQILKGLV